jgi:hypothetical protein
VLLLSLDESTIQDVADALGMAASVVATVRQSIRRKLAVPKGADLRDFLRMHDIDHETLAIEVPLDDRQTDRRRRFVLRAAIHELELALSRILSKGKTLCRLADQSPAEDREVLLAEVAVIDTVALELEELLRRAIADARATNAHAV